MVFDGILFQDAIMTILSIDVADKNATIVSTSGVVFLNMDFLTAEDNTATGRPVMVSTKLAGRGFRRNIGLSGYHDDC